MNHDGTARINAFLLRFAAVLHIRIGDADRQEVFAVRILNIQQIPALRRSEVAFLLLVTDGTDPESNTEGLEYLAVA